MDFKHNKNLVPFAKRLRREMTKEERHLWYDFLKDYPVKIYRQKIVGNYILDFYCEKAKLAIELDGSQHYEDAGQEYDKKRTMYLNELGIEVFRVSNLDVNRNFRGVCDAIHIHLSVSLEADSRRTAEFTAADPA